MITLALISFNSDDTDHGLQGKAIGAAAERQLCRGAHHKPAKAGVLNTRAADYKS